MNDDPCSKPSRLARLLWFLLLFPLLIAIAWASSASAQEHEADDDALPQRAEVYSQLCSTCHQPGGIGINEQFPPLVNNPRAADTDYLRTVITDGVEGELVVNGVSYDGRMPAFSTLPEEDIEAVTDRLDLPWLNAWAKSAVIVIWFVLFTVFVPSWVLQSDSVAKMADTTQDLVGAGVWSAGLVLGIETLWWAQREKRV
jgi:mono/diheme cytochrome c family protein